MSRLGDFLLWTLRSFMGLSVGGGTGRIPRGSSCGKEPKPKTVGFSTPGAPVASQQGAADLVAFGPFRHRAWVVGQRPLECSSGSCGRPLGDLWEVVLRPLGGRFGASWGFFSVSRGPLGGPLGASSEPQVIQVSFGFLSSGSAMCSTWPCPRVPPPKGAG